MPLEIGQRLHALTHRLFKTSDAVAARELFDEVEGLFRAEHFYHPLARPWLAFRLTAELSEAFGVLPQHPRQYDMFDIIYRVLDYEALFVLPDINWDEQRSISEHWGIRDYLARQKRLLTDLPATYALLRDVLFAWLQPLFENADDDFQIMQPPEGITIPTVALHLAGNVPEAVAGIVSVIDDEVIAESDLLPRHTRNIKRNIIRASGGDPDDPRGFSRTLRSPEQADPKQPEKVVSDYLGGTPLADMFEQAVDFTILTKTRFEHMMCVAGSGHGKTQMLQYLIANDLPAVIEGNRTVIVIDSQGDLLKNISNLAVFGPGGPLHDKLTIIDPTDVAYPVSLNMFDVGTDRLKEYDPLERERLTNSILELYDFVLGNLLDAGMTQKQSVIFRYVTRLMLHIPDGTIHTLRELMEEGAEEKFAPHIAKLSGSARHFFDTEFAGREFKQTKQQVLRRLWGILENQTFERMFSHPRSKFDMFEEMNAGRVILINTAKDLLKEQGTQIFGRFFIALITQAAQERATMPAAARLPTMVYEDEAADYFDRNIGIILQQARKYSVGLVTASQFLGQMEPKLQEAVAANTSIKFAGGVSAKDARTLAPMMYCDPSLIESQPKGGFAAYVRGTTKGAVPLQFPLGFMERLEQMDTAARQALTDQMRTRYSVHISEVQTNTAAEPTTAPPEEPSPQEVEQPDTEPGDQW